MGGVELAPPADGLRWGRRVCAAAVRRGVLLRPLGDVVVLMPPLTVTTADEIERIVDVLAEAIDEVAVTWASRGGLGRRGDLDRDAGRWGRAQPRLPPGPGDRGRRPAHPSCRLRPTTTSASPATPPSSPPPTTRSTAGAPGRARPVSSSARPLHAELEAELAAWKGCEQAVLFPTGFAANLGVLTTFGDPGTLVCSDELNHASIIDGCPAQQGRGRRLPPWRRGPRCALLADAGGPSGRSS